MRTSNFGTEHRNITSGTLRENSSDTEHDDPFYVFFVCFVVVRCCLWLFCFFFCVCVCCFCWCVFHGHSCHSFSFAFYLISPGVSRSFRKTPVCTLFFVPCYFSLFFLRLPMD